MTHLIFNVNIARRALLNVVILKGILELTSKKNLLSVIIVRRDLIKSGISPFI